VLKEMVALFSFGTNTIIIMNENEIFTCSNEDASCVCFLMLRVEHVRLNKEHEAMLRVPEVAMKQCFKLEQDSQHR